MDPGRHVLTFGGRDGEYWCHSAKAACVSKGKPNDVDSQIMKDIHLQFMKGKYSLDAKLIKLDQEKIELST